MYILCIRTRTTHADTKAKVHQYTRTMVTGKNTDNLRGSSQFALGPHNKGILSMMTLVNTNILVAIGQVRSRGEHEEGSITLDPSSGRPLVSH